MVPLIIPGLYHFWSWIIFFSLAFCSLNCRTSFTVSKETGPSLEFGCTTYPDEVLIDCMSVKEREASEDQIAYEGSDFSDLDENLQKVFLKYLEIRGIKASATNFLHEYMKMVLI